MKRISLLDCTLRDGCYIVNGKFGADSIKGITSKLCDAGVDIIECGWLKNEEYIKGTAYYHRPSDLIELIKDKNSNQIYTVMIDWDRYDIDFLTEYDGKTIDAIRIVFPVGKWSNAVEVGKKIRDKGYRVMFQAANTLAYGKEDLEKLTMAMNCFKPDCVSIVDTFGAMYEEDLDRIIFELESKLDSSISIGFHSHNNQQLAFSNAIHFLKKVNNSNRNVVVDSSLCGMGRGAGNATTELLVSYLNRKYGTHYNLDSIMDAIDTYMGFFIENYQWGYSTPFFIAGLYCCHVNNISYLLENHRTSSKDMRNIIESLSPEERRKYDYSNLENKYLENQSRHFDDANSIKELKKTFKNKKIVLIAPGKTALTSQTKINNEYLLDQDVITIGVNAIIPGYNYDYIFFMNQSRFEYATNSFPEQVKNTVLILASNIKNTVFDNQYIIEYEKLIKRGWNHFDNAMICCLRLMDLLEIKKVYVCGFDGFKTKYNESYADPYLPTLSGDIDWDKLNIEVLDMFRDFKNCTKNCRDVVFLTESIFNEN